MSSFKESAGRDPHAHRKLARPARAPARRKPDQVRARSSPCSDVNPARYLCWQCDGMRRADVTCCAPSLTDQKVAHRTKGAISCAEDIVCARACVRVCLCKPTHPPALPPPGPSRWSSARSPVLRSSTSTTTRAIYCLRGLPRRGSMLSWNISRGTAATQTDYRLPTLVFPFGVHKRRVCVCV